MKIIISMILFLAAGMTLADTVIGERCYKIEPVTSPVDNGIEHLWIVERGEPGSGVFDSVGYHEDIAGIRTPIQATSYRNIARDGTVQYIRTTYGVLGQVEQEIKLANMGSVEKMWGITHKTAIFVSTATLIEAIDGSGLTGTFRADVWHHDWDVVNEVVGGNDASGLIYSIRCNS